MKQATARAAANWRRVYAMPVASVYPSYIAKAEKKGRTRAQVDEIFRWLTGHSQASLEAEFAKKTSFEDFFAHAPNHRRTRQGQGDGKDPPQIAARARKLARGGPRRPQGSYLRARIPPPAHTSRLRLRDQSLHQRRIT